MTLTVGGEIDLSSVAHLRAALRGLGPGEPGSGRVAILDVTAVTFADLSVVALIAALAAARQISGGRLLLAGASPALTSLLTVSGVLAHVDTLARLPASERQS